MCLQLGFSLGIYLRPFLCGKLPLLSRDLIVATTRGHGAGETPLPTGCCHAVLGTPRTTAAHTQHLLLICLFLPVGCVSPARVSEPRALIKLVV